MPSVDDFNDAHLLDLFEKDAMDEARPDSSWNNLLLGNNNMSKTSLNSSDSLQLSLSMLESSLNSMALADSALNLSNNGTNHGSSEEKGKKGHHHHHHHHHHSHHHNSNPQGNIGLSMLQAAYDQYHESQNDVLTSSSSTIKMGSTRAECKEQDVYTNSNNNNNNIAMPAPSLMNLQQHHHHHHTTSVPTPPTSAAVQDLSFLQSVAPPPPTTTSAAAAVAPPPQQNLLLGPPFIQPIFGSRIQFPFDRKGSLGSASVTSNPAITTTTTTSENSNSSNSTSTAALRMPANIARPDAAASGLSNSSPTSDRDTVNARLEQLLRPTSATAAVDLQKLAAFPAENFPSTVSCKGKAFPPLRPLSAYNYFFREERDRLLNKNDAYADTTARGQNMSERGHKLLWGHWGQDRTQKRPHRKSHGKISFAELTKVISTRWKALTGPEQDFYQQLAALDMQRFKKETDRIKKTEQQEKKKAAAETKKKKQTTTGKETETAQEV